MFAHWMFVFDSHHEVSLRYCFKSDTHHSYTVEIGKQSRVILALSTGRNAVSKAMLRLAAPSGVQFHLDQFSLEGQGKPPWSSA